MRKNSIQFFGLPGSGKTTLLRSLLAAFPEQYEPIPKFSRTKRFLFAFLFFVRYPRIAFFFLRLAFQNPRKLWGYVFHLVSHSWAAHAYVYVYRNRHKTFLIDEGVAQRFLSVAPRVFSPQEVVCIGRFLEILNFPVVVASGGNFSRFELELDRMISHRNALGEEYYTTWSENLKTNFSLIQKDLSSYSGLSCEATQVEELHSRIQDLLR